MKIYEQLLRQSVFTIKEVDAIYGNRNSAASALRSLQKRGLVEKIRKNLYVCNDIETKVPIADRYKIGSSITKDAYISHHSALEYYGLGHQLFFEVYVSSSVPFKPFVFDGVAYKYVPSKTTTGVLQYQSSRGIRVTDMERTIIDCLNDLDKAGGLGEFLQCLVLLTYLDSERLSKYLEIYNKQYLYQKTGFILEHFKDQLKLSDQFFDYCQSQVHKSKRYLTDKNDSDLSYNSRWRLFVPTGLLDFLVQGADEHV